MGEPRLLLPRSTLATSSELKFIILFLLLLRTFSVVGEAWLKIRLDKKEEISRYVPAILALRRDKQEVQIFKVVLATHWVPDQRGLCETLPRKEIILSSGHSVHKHASSAISASQTPC